MFLVNLFEFRRSHPILKDNFSGRNILICREMSKLYEEFIRFEIDNIHINQTISTYIKFGKSFGITLSSSTSNYGNISYMTSITGASAQGGNAPVAFVNDLIREKGSGYTFINDNKQYPRTNE